MHQVVEKVDYFSSFSSALTGLGILAAGFWAAWHFMMRRERYPKAELQHDTEFWDISGAERVLRIKLRIANKSNVILRINKGCTYVSQLLPTPQQEVDDFKTQVCKADACYEQCRGLENHTQDMVKSYIPPDEVQWPLLSAKYHSDREVEPQESDEICMDVILGRNVERVLIYSFIDNSKKVFWRKIRNQIVCPEENRTVKDFGWCLSTTVHFCQESSANKPSI